MVIIDQLMLIKAFLAKDDDLENDVRRINQFNS